MKGHPLTTNVRDFNDPWQAFILQSKVSITTISSPAQVKQFFNSKGLYNGQGQESVFCLTAMGRSCAPFPIQTESATMSGWRWPRWRWQEHQHRPLEGSCHTPVSTPSAVALQRRHPENWRNEKKKKEANLNHDILSKSTDLKLQTNFFEVKLTILNQSNNWFHSFMASNHPLQLITCTLIELLIWRQVELYAYTVFPSSTSITKVRWTVFTSLGTKRTTTFFCSNGRNSPLWGWNVKSLTDWNTTAKYRSA